MTGDFQCRRAEDAGNSGAREEHARHVKRRVASHGRSEQAAGEDAIVDASVLQDDRRNQRPLHLVPLPSLWFVYWRR